MIARKLNDLGLDVTICNAGVYRFAMFALADVD